MFCPFCGTATLEGASFCSKCGKQITSIVEFNKPAFPMQNPVEIQVQQYQIQKNALRKSEIDSLSTAVSHFSQKSAQFKEYDHVCEKIKYYARGAKSSLLVWGCIISTFGLLILLAATTGDESALIGALLTLVPGIIMIIGGILMKIGNRRNYNSYQQKYAALSKEIYNHYLTCPNCPVGPEYINPEILILLLNVLQSGRADTVKESINLVIDDAHQAEVREYLATIEQYTAEINAQTRVTTTFVSASFFI